MDSPMQVDAAGRPGVVLNPFLLYCIDAPSCYPHVRSPRRWRPKPDHPRPLLIDRVLQPSAGLEWNLGRPVASMGQLLSRLPAEILTEIVFYLRDDRPALRNLALASSGCCQLARTVLFAHVYLDYGHKSIELLEKLLSESRDEERGGPSAQKGVGVLSGLKISPCVRLLSVCPEHYWLHKSLDLLYSVKHGEPLPRETTYDQRREVVADATTLYLEAFHNPVFEILSNHGLPNLDSLTWEDPIPVDNRLSGLIAATTVRSLEIKANTTVPLVFNCEAASGMRLRSLRICINPLPYDEDQLRQPLEDWHYDLLRCCASTLESLEWRNSPGGFRPGNPPAEPIPLPNLRRHVLPPFSMVNRQRPMVVALPRGPSVQAVLLPNIPSPNLRVLNLGELCQEEDGFPALSSLGPFPHLEAFSVSTIQTPNLAAQVVAFLSRHSARLARLCIDITSVSLMNSHILPLLGTGGFSRLRSLRLWWSNGEREDLALIPRGPQEHYEQTPFLPESLAHIASLASSLEQLCIVAGDSDLRVAPEVAVPHAALRRGLAPLKNLRKLAFVKDRYYQEPFMMPPLLPAMRGPLSSSDRQHIPRHIRKPPCTPLRELSEKRPELDVGAPVYPEGCVEFNVMWWRRGYRNLLLDEVDAYADTFPSLEWVYCGMLEFGVSSSENGQDRRKRAAHLIEWPKDEEWYPAVWRVEEPIKRVFGI